MNTIGYPCNLVGVIEKPEAVAMVAATQAKKSPSGGHGWRSAYNPDARTTCTSIEPYPPCPSTNKAPSAGQASKGG